MVHGHRHHGHHDLHGNGLRKRGAAMEALAAHDQTIDFRVSAQQVRLMASWAAKSMPFNIDLDLDAYVKGLVRLGVDKGFRLALDAVKGDLAHWGKPMTDMAFAEESSKFLRRARTIVEEEATEESGASRPGVKPRGDSPKQ